MNDILRTHQTEPSSYNFTPPNSQFRMASKKYTATLRKVLTRAENEEKRNRIDPALLKAHKIKGCGKGPNFYELAEEYNVSHSTPRHQFNGRIYK